MPIYCQVGGSLSGISRGGYKSELFYAVLWILVFIVCITAYAQNVIWLLRSIVRNRRGYQVEFRNIKSISDYSKRIYNHNSNHIHNQES